MRALKSAYMAFDANYDKKATYIFVVPSFTSGGLDGFMVRGRSVGFITSAADNRTIAHELGHGVFGLEHTFPEIEKQTTNNLMDYGTGTHLTHEQWKIIHARKPAYSWFDSEEDGSYETDGHYSTVYLVCLMLGMDKEKAKQLAIATEAPDTSIHDETHFELNDTWANGTYQESIHALTGGFHGTEEFLTAIEFICTKQENVSKLGELLHRFGDSYAHTKLDNIKPADLKTYELKDTPANENKAILAWTGKGGERLENKIESWIKYFNREANSFGLEKMLKDEQLQKDLFLGKTLKQQLELIYLVNPTDRFVMYGGNKWFGFTTDHFGSDEGFPDKIYMRPEWYLTYVKNLAWIISVRYKLNSTNLDMNVFEQMVHYAKQNSCSLKGIIDYEIAKKLNKKTFNIPVFYSKLKRTAATIDDKLFSDYQKIATDAKEHALNYIKIDRIYFDSTTELIKEHKIRFPAVGRFETIGFRINLK